MTAYFEERREVFFWAKAPGETERQFPVRFNYDIWNKITTQKDYRHPISGKLSVLLSNCETIVIDFSTLYDVTSHSSKWKGAYTNTSTKAEYDVIVNARVADGFESEEISLMHREINESLKKFKHIEDSTDKGVCESCKIISDSPMCKLPCCGKPRCALCWLIWIYDKETKQTKAPCLVCNKPFIEADLIMI